MTHTDDSDYPTYDTTIDLPPKCGNISIFGLVNIKDANYAAEPGRFEEEVDLGINFNSQPVIQLTIKYMHDDDGSVYDNGDHEFGYRWLDADHYRKFEIMVISTRLNYPPSIAYTVTGRLGFFQRFIYCLSIFFKTN